MTYRFLRIFFFFCFGFLGCTNSSNQNAFQPTGTSSVSESNVLKLEEKTYADLSTPKTAPTPEPIDGKSFEKIKISGETVAAISDGDFVLPKFSPDGKKIAYSKVIIEKDKGETTENTEVHLYDINQKSATILLDAKAARKYAVYASFVNELEWLNSNQLRVSISDGDVDSSILIFDTRTRRVSKKGYSNDGADEIYPAELKPVYSSLIKTFPEIPKDVAITAFNLQQIFKVGSRGAVAQFGYYEYDSNIWFFDFQTKKKQLLVEAPKDEKNFSLTGALEVENNVLLMVKNNKQTQFFSYRDGNVTQIGEIDSGGDFQIKFTSAQKAFFLLKQPNSQSEKPSSLWLFDGNELQRVTDVENLCDVDIDASGEQIAFCYWIDDKKRDISIRELKKDF